MLERYRHDTRVMAVGGNNLERQQDREREYSCTFTRLTYIWGWATWRRAWKLHDYHMTAYGEVNRKKYLLPACDSIFERDLFQYVFERMYGETMSAPVEGISGTISGSSCMANSGLVVVPAVNLVANIGCGLDATSTTAESPGSNLICEDLTFPLVHPEFVMVDSAREQRTFELCHTSRTSRMKSRIRQVIPSRLLSTIRTLF